MTELQRKIEKLQDINAELAGNLQTLQNLRAQAKREIDGEGLTQETCEQISVLLRSMEEAARKGYTGLLSVHQSMQLIAEAQGMSEGGKPWPP